MAEFTLHPHARDLLADHYSGIDADLPELLTLLFARSAGEDWHKAGTFKHHLLGVYRTLALWNQPREVRLLGLFHSVYGNEYVDLTLFDRDREREVLRQALGQEAEQWVHRFCAMPRTAFVQRLLQAQAQDEDLSAGLALAGPDGQAHALSGREVAAFAIVSAADVAEQWHSWQDEIFAGYPHQARRELAPNWAASLWPGPLKPPANVLHMLSRLLRPVARLSGTGLPVPPAFGGCAATLEAADEAAASALYWQAITRMHPLTEMDSVRHIVQAAAAHNPWVGEPRLLLAQLALTAGDWDGAAGHAADGLAALQAWGTAWDKRIDWTGWMAWGRILLQSARQRHWPATLGGLNGLGLVQG
ncbi:DUF6817 domain-containing protein [Orrella sp. JC864]|uniref:DUF6817 domain-containing protein n=1 Tax=Orrella sp. JC864 TaxID=3120298 RepID=UPI00300913A8